MLNIKDVAVNSETSYTTYASFIKAPIQFYATIENISDQNWEVQVIYVFRKTNVDRDYLGELYSTKFTVPANSTESYAFSSSVYLRDRGDVPITWPRQADIDEFPIGSYTVDAAVIDPAIADENERSCSGANNLEPFNIVSCSGRARILGTDVSVSPSDVKPGDTVNVEVKLTTPETEYRQFKITAEVKDQLGRYQGNLDSAEEDWFAGASRAQPYTTDWDWTVARNSRIGLYKVDFSVLNQWDTDDICYREPGLASFTVHPSSAIDDIDCSPSSPEIAETVTCTADFSGSTPTTYQWSASNTTRTSASESYETSWSAAGSKTVYLSVSNAYGDDSDSARVTVSQAPPEMVTVTINSDPTGREVTVGPGSNGISRNTPYETTIESGSAFRLNVPYEQTAGYTRYLFERWSDGGLQSRNVRTTSDASYTAEFRTEYRLFTGPGQTVNGGGWYAKGSSATISPSVSSDIRWERFSHWEKDGQNIGTSASGVTVTVDRPGIAVVARFGDAPPPEPVQTGTPPTITSFHAMVGSTRVNSRTISASPGDRIVFSASANDPDGNLNAYKWEIGNLVVVDRDASGASTTQTYEHTTRSGQDYTITATFTDDDNDSVSVVWTIDVADRNQGITLAGGLTMDDVPEGWDPLAKLIYAALEESSIGVGSWDIPDVKVYVGTEPAGSTERVLRVRLEHDAAAIVKELTARSQEMVDLIDDLLMEIGITDPDKIDEILRPIIHESLVLALENIGIKGTFLQVEITDFWGNTYTSPGLDVADFIASRLTDVFILGAQASAIVIDTALDALRQGLSLLNSSGEFVTRVVEGVSTVITIAAAVAGGPVSALSAVFLLDFVLGFDSIGQVTVVVPKYTWIDFDNERREIDRFWTRGYANYSKFQEADQVQIRLAAEQVIDVAIEVTLGSALPVVGSWLNAGLGSVEYLSEAFPEEFQGPQSAWFKEQSYNCTNRITVPWDLALINARGIDIQFPIDFAHGDYIGVYSNFTTYSTWKSVLNVNIPFVREHGEFEVTGEFRAGEPLNTDVNPPICDRSTFAEDKPTGRPAVTSSPSVLTVNEGSSATYSVRLDTAPSSTVTVRVSGNSGSDLTVSPASLTFTPGNWNNPRTVTVTARQDVDAVPDDFITLVHTATGGDYTGTARENTVVIIGEDETTALANTGKRWQSSATEIIPRDGTGGRLEVRVLNVGVGINDTTEVTIEGPELDRTRSANRCSLTYRPFGYVSGANGTKCWDTFFSLPVNDTGGALTYKVTATSGEIDEELVTEVTVSPTPVADQAPVPTRIAWGPQGLTASPQALGAAGGAVVARVVTSGSAETPSFAISGPMVTGATSKRVCDKVQRLA